MESSCWDCEFSQSLEELESRQAGPGSGRADAPYPRAWTSPILMAFSRENEMA